MRNRFASSTENNGEVVEKINRKVDSSLPWEVEPISSVVENQREHRSSKPPENPTIAVSRRI